MPALQLGPVENSLFGDIEADLRYTMQSSYLYEHYCTLRQLKLEGSEI
jgi:hypothetical protein